MVSEARCMMGMEMNVRRLDKRQIMEYGSLEFRVPLAPQRFRESYLNQINSVEFCVSLNLSVCKLNYSGERTWSSLCVHSL